MCAPKEDPLSRAQLLPAVDLQSPSLIAPGHTLRRRIRSIAKLIKVGRVEPVMVLRVDEEKGYIDLSKRRVSPEEAMIAEEKYAKARLVNSIVTHVATILNRDLLKLNETLTWPLYRKYGSAYDAFRMAASNPDEVFGEFNLDDELKVRHCRPLGPAMGASPPYGGIVALLCTTRKRCMRMVPCHPDAAPSAPCCHPAAAFAAGAVGHRRCCS